MHHAMAAAEQPTSSFAARGQGRIPAEQWSATRSRDVDRAIRFYITDLSFTLEQRTGPSSPLSRAALFLLLSGPGSSGSRRCRRRQQEPAARTGSSCM